MGQLSFLDPGADGGVGEGGTIGGGMNPDREICNRNLFGSCVTIGGGGIVVVVVVVVVVVTAEIRISSKN